MIKQDIGCERMELTLISTIYSLEPVMASITKFSPDKLVLLREEDAPEKKKESERMLMETVGKVIGIDAKITSIYDVVKIAQDTADVIDTETANGKRVIVNVSGGRKTQADGHAGERVIVNVSGGRKTQALGALFGSYARHKHVERIVYLTEEDGAVVDLPILNFGISPTKQDILEKMKEGETSVKNLAVKVGISRGMTYNHIRELREIGFIAQNKLEITSAGELAII